MAIHDHESGIERLKVCVLCATPPHAYDAVGDACWRLALELGRATRVSLVVSGCNGVNLDGEAANVTVLEVSAGWGIRTFRDVTRQIKQLKPDVVLVHFVPQLYGWNGAKPGLAVLLQFLKLRGCRIVTVAHELGVSIGPSPKLLAWAAIHRLILRMVVGASQQIVLTTRPRCDMFKQRFKRRRDDCRHIAIGCSIPVVHADRVHGREELCQRFGIAREPLLITTLFGSAVPSVIPVYKQLFSRMITAGLPFQVLAIGKAGATFRRLLGGTPAVVERIHLTGPVPESDLSRFLSLSDLYVTFYPDGASTRRTSLLAGLAHGVPTISNCGPSTEPELASSGALCLIDCPENEQEFRKVSDLCRDAELRSPLAERGRLYHDQHHSWSQIGRQYLQLMTDAAPSD